MFGYIAPSLESLQPAEKDRYLACYCGLCRSLGQHAQRCRMALSYDMVFLALVLGSLYEPQEHTGVGRCPPHPVKPRAFVRSECLDYAADMTVALAYHKCLDDWEDDRNAFARALAGALKRPYAAVKQRHPRPCAMIEAQMAAIGAIERAARGTYEKTSPEANGHKADAGDAQLADSLDPDAAANLFGVLLGEVFAWKQDFWADDLRRFGARLGKFIYVMDASIDFEADKKSGSYNPLVARCTSPKEQEEGLQLLASGAAESFEKLPLERDLHLLRSVLYAGMWQRYYAKDKKERHG